MRSHVDRLVAAMGCTRERAEVFAEPLAAACALYGITTPERLAAFYAQIGHESGALTYTSEIWGPTPAQRRYEGRADLGNTQPGDGERFKGHGLIQTTGRYNHARVRDRLRERFPNLEVPDFEADPERLTEPQWAALSAADYWDDRKLNALADAGDFLTITKRINGGVNGLADRQARWERAKKALITSDLGTEPTPQAPAITPEPTKAPPTPPARPSPVSTKEPPMGPLAAPLLMGLANSLIQVFTPLAKEKIQKEMGRHTENPEVASQIATSVIDTAKALTTKADPIEAVVAARGDPVILQQIEEDALATLERLAPLLDKIAGWEKDAWEAEESSRDAASKRAAADPHDQDVFLTRAIVALLVVLLVAIGALIAVLTYLKADAGTIGTLVGLFAATGGVIVGKFGTRYDHRYGSSRSSGAKDVVISELSRRPPAKP